MYYIWHTLVSRQELFVAVDVDVDAMWVFRRKESIAFLQFFQVFIYLFSFAN
jgi:hypothetical protein